VLEDDEFLALNPLYLKKIAALKDLPAIAGLSADELGAWMSRFAERGWVIEMDGEVLIQPEGMTEVDKYYRHRYADEALRAELSEWYARFEKVNTQFIRLVSDWQQSEGDPKVEKRVLMTVERLAKSIGNVTHHVPRYDGYIRRFEQGVVSVDQGRTEYVCSPAVDSLHNIWFEFHEDVLTVLGRPRDT